MNRSLRSSSQQRSPLLCGSGDEGIKLTPKGEEDSRPISIINRLN
jgi:hypothetical protein